MPTATMDKPIVIPDMDTNEVPIDIVGAFDRELEKKKRISPCHSNRASDIGHPCVRFLVFKRTRWQDMIPPDLGLLRIFGEGNLQEKDVVKQLGEAGIELIHQQIDLCVEEFNITGHIDGQIVVPAYEDGTIPAEIKSTNPYDYIKIKTVADMVKSPRVWWQKYPGQMTIYLHTTKKKLGVFLFKNKLSGEIKQVFCKYDPEYAESLLEKAWIINEHVASNTLPDPIPPQENICGRCGFLSICTPDRKFGDALSAQQDPVIEDWLEERERLKDSVRRYKELDKNVKHAIEGQPNLLIGKYHITGKMVKRDGYTVKPSEYWLPNILYIG
jgi:hypothetical protein